jgi:hypothetical protein
VLAKLLSRDREGLARHATGDKIDAFEGRGVEGGDIALDDGPAGPVAP